MSGQHFWSAIFNIHDDTSRSLRPVNMYNNNTFPTYNDLGNVAPVSSPDTHKYADLPRELVQRSNSVRSSISLDSHCSSIDCSPVSSPIEKPTEPPAFIILSLWPQATKAQIASYVDGYKTLYPNAQTLLLHNSWSASRPDMDSILDTLTAAKEKPSLNPEAVLLHLFGRSGATNACNLLRAYRLRTNSPMNIRAIVSDTEPSTLTSTTIKSPLDILLLIYLAILNIWTFIASLVMLWDDEASTNRIREDLTNPQLLPANTRKCFVFAHQDVMFSWGEIGEDGQAARQEYKVKRKGVDACGRWTGDQERYWMSIEGVWEGR